MPAGADGNLKLGNNDIDALNFGSGEADAVYWGSNEVWKNEATRMYLVDDTNDRLRVINIDGTEDTTRTIDYAPFTGSIQGAFEYNHHAYLIDRQNYHLRVYNIASRTRQTSLEHSLQTDSWRGGFYYDGKAYLISARTGVLARVRTFDLSTNTTQTAFTFSGNNIIRGAFEHEGFGYFLRAGSSGIILVYNLSNNNIDVSKTINVTSPNADSMFLSRRSRTYSTSQ